MLQTRLLTAAVVSSVLAVRAAPAQVPADLRAAMQARDSAVAKANVTVWDRLTASTFTVVQEDGSMMTKAERISQLKTQSATPFEPRARETVNHYGDVWVARYLTGNVWVLEVWIKENDAWKVAAVQVTTAKK